MYNGTLVGNMTGILYFSSTGNSLYIAQRVKDALGGQIKYIPNYEGDGSEFERIILVTPIYSYGMPTFVYDLIPRLNKTTELIIIQNYGGMVSGADYLVYQYAKEYELNIKAIYVLKMPENFTTTFTVPKFYIKSTVPARGWCFYALKPNIIKGENNGKDSDRLRPVGLPPEGRTEGISCRKRL